MKIEKLIERLSEIKDPRRSYGNIRHKNEFAYAVRKHWSIGNQLHWCLDVIFNEDASRAKKGTELKTV